MSSFRDLLGVAWTGLIARKVRTLLIMLGPIVGVAAMVGAVGLTESAKGDLKAKLAVLGAVYGQTSGDGLKNLAALRRRFPRAVAYVDEAARAGEEGRLVRTWLGRTCPPAVGAADSAEEAGIPQDEPPVEGVAPADADEWVPGYASTNSRARGRFARNFVVQGSAADWALLVLAALRRSCADLAAELVFFQHDEFVVHCPEGESDAVVAAVHTAGDEARRLLFAETPVRFPLDVAVVACYAEAK